MIPASVLIDRLQNFVSQIPDVEGAALVSPDGLPITSVLPSKLDEEETAAMSAAILSSGEKSSQNLMLGTVEQIIIEGEKGYSILVNFGAEVLLLVFATKTAQKGLLFLAIKRLVSEITTLLS